MYRALTHSAAVAAVTFVDQTRAAGCGEKPSSKQTPANIRFVPLLLSPLFTLQPPLFFFPLTPPSPCRPVALLQSSLGKADCGLVEKKTPKKPNSQGVETERGGRRVSKSAHLLYRYRIIHPRRKTQWTVDIYFVQSGGKVHDSTLFLSFLSSLGHITFKPYRLFGHLKRNNL